MLPLARTENRFDIARHLKIKPGMLSTPRDDATYNAVKTELVATGKLVPGKGRGGSVSLPNS